MFLLFVMPYNKDNPSLPSPYTGEALFEGHRGTDFCLIYALIR